MKYLHDVQGVLVLSYFPSKGRGVSLSYPQKAFHYLVSFETYSMLAHLFSSGDLLQSGYDTENLLLITVYQGCSQDSKSKGVSILSHNSVPWSFHGSWKDGGCEALFLKGTISQLLYTLVNLYLPNTNHISFLEFTLEKLGNFANCSVILGGDFNLTLDLLIDASCTFSPLLRCS